MIGLVLAGLLAGAVLIQMAISRPWLALAFTADDSGIIHVTPASGVDGSAIVSGPIAAIRGSDGRRVAIEAGVEMGWRRLLRPDDAFVGLNDFGASAPAGALFEHFGLTAKRAAELARGLVVGGS